MIYTKIRLDFKHGPKNRFYRIILVKGDPDLFELGTCLGLALGATFEHCFLIRAEKSSYVFASFFEYPCDGYKYLRNYHLSDLPNNFIYEYDTGEGYDFSCIRYKEKVELKNTRQKIIVLEGKGQGIWEDNISSLAALFEGKIDPKTTENDEEKGIYKPWNYEINEFGDFDLPLDIKSLNIELKNASRIIRQMLSGELQYIEETNIPLDDYYDNSMSFHEYLKLKKDKYKA